MNKAVVHSCTALFIITAFTLFLATVGQQAEPQPLEPQGHEYIPAWNRQPTGAPNAMPSSACGAISTAIMTNGAAAVQVESLRLLLLAASSHRQLLTVPATSTAAASPRSASTQSANSTAAEHRGRAAAVVEPLMNAATGSHQDNELAPSPRGAAATSTPLQNELASLGSELPATSSVPPSQDAALSAAAAAGQSAARTARLLLPPIAEPLPPAVMAAVSESVPAASPVPLATPTERAASAAGLSTPKPAMQPPAAARAARAAAAAAARTAAAAPPKKAHGTHLAEAAAVIAATTAAKKVMSNAAASGKTVVANRGSTFLASNPLLPLGVRAGLTSALLRYQAAQVPLTLNAAPLGLKPSKQPALPKLPQAGPSALELTDKVNMLGTLVPASAGTPSASPRAADPSLMQVKALAGRSAAAGDAAAVALPQPAVPVPLPRVQPRIVTPLGARLFLPSLIRGTLGSAAASKMPLLNAVKAQMGNSRPSASGTPQLPFKPQQPPPLPTIADPTKSASMKPGTKGQGPDMQLPGSSAAASASGSRGLPGPAAAAAATSAVASKNLPRMLVGAVTPAANQVQQVLSKASDLITGPTRPPLPPPIKLSDLDSLPSGRRL